MIALPYTEPVVYYAVRLSRRLVVCVCFVPLMLCGRLAADIPTVGMEGATNIVLPGPLLAAKPVNERSLVVLRIVDSYLHGSATRYDVRYIGLLPGSYNLRDYLVYTSGTPATNLPEISVEIAPLLPEEFSGKLVEDALPSVPLFSRFRELVIAVWILWAVLLIPILLYKRKQYGGAGAEEPPHQPGIAERLRPLVEKAAEGLLSAEEQSHLEMLLIAYWRHELSLESLSMNESLER